MAVFKRYKGRRIKPNHPNWDEAIWQVEFVLRGHDVRQSVPEAQNKKQALQAEASIRQAIYDRKYNKASATTKFSDFVDKVYIPWSKDNNRSWRDDEQRATKLKEFFEQRAIRDITPILIEKLKSGMRKADSKYKRPYSPATVNRYLYTLSRILSMAFENGIIDSNPVARVKKLSEPEARDRYLNQYAVDEEERLMSALAVYGEHPAALVEFDLEAGMRLGELLKARWRDVQNRSIAIPETKTDKARTVPLTGRALKILARLRQDATEDELIFDPKRTGRRRRQLLYCFEKAVKTAGITDFHFHDLRRTFATRLRAANVHAYDIADLLGHSVPEGETRQTRITRGYARAVPQRLVDAVNSLEEGKQIILEGWRREAVG